MSSEKQRQRQVSLKLIIDKKGRRILYAEADKTFIDFLFSILAYPVGCVVNLLSNKGMVGSITNVHRSVGDLNIDYFQPQLKKDSLLLRTGIQERALTQYKNVFLPHSYHSYEEEGGYVKGMVTYMVMDDLSVIPMSSMSSLAKLKDFNVHDVSQIEDRLVVLDTNQALNLLKASLHSSTVLTDVFLPNIHFP